MVLKAAITVVAEDKLLKKALGVSHSRQIAFSCGRH